VFVLFDNLSKSQSDLCTLVLSAEGISHRIKKDKNGWEVLVDEVNYEHALDVMKTYFHENISIDMINENEPEITFSDVASSILAACLILAYHMIIFFSGNHHRIVDQFGASASEILNGDIYRAITSLTLHANSLHLIGNMTGIVLFGAVVTSITGWGLGWLMILFSGAFGNWINALMYESGHNSIGASTAVFGAIGILVGYQMIKKRKGPGSLKVSWLPLACGIALLGLFSSGENVDITAHLFGFVSGVTGGILYTKKIKNAPQRAYQSLFGLIVFMVIGFSWVIGWQ